MFHLEVFKHIPFLDEALWDWIKGFFLKGGEATQKLVNDDVQTARRAVSLLWTNKINATARENWKRVVWENPDFRPYRQAVEVALEDLLERYEERMGFFPQTVEGEKTVPRGKDKPITVKPRMTPLEGFKPEDLFIEAVNNAGASEREVKLFVEAITDQSFFQRTTEGIGEVLKKHAPTKGQIALFLGIYFGFLVLCLWGMKVTFGNFIEEPDRFGSFVWGLVWLVMFSIVSYPFFRIILPKA